MDKVKQWFKSWTINFGLLLQLAAVIQIFVEGQGNPVYTMIVGLVVIALRFKTTQAVEDK